MINLSKKICLIPQCEKTHHAFGLCSSHASAYNKGTLLNVPDGVELIYQTGKKICSYEECLQKVVARGFCRKHYTEFITNVDGAKHTTNTRKTKADFIKDAKEVHGEKYNYQKVKYKGNRVGIIIICPNKNHGPKNNGEFLQSPYNHLMGKGCKDCGIEKSAATRLRNAAEKFFINAPKIHHGYYGYDKVIYKGKGVPIQIWCPVHGYFNTQSPSNHLKGRGCTPCGRKRCAEFHRSSREVFVRKAKLIHEDIYNYDKVVYIRAIDDVIITCKVSGHGEKGNGDFLQTPASHLGGSGCHDCGGSKRLTKEEFIEKALLIHGDFYTYDKVVYVSNKKSVTIQCPIHKDFPQTPDAHLAGKGCNKCKNKHEGKLAEYLNSMHVVHREYKIDNRRYDFYLPEYNMLVERDGEQHYRETTLFTTSLSEQRKIDEEKTKLAKTNGFKIARIPFWLNQTEAQLEINNILNGKPSYPDIPDLKQAESKPSPK